MADKREMDKLVVDMVNGVFDLTEVPVEKRKVLADRVNGFIKKVLRDSTPVVGNRMPTWIECSKVIECGDGTPLHRFIYDYDDGDGFIEKLARVFHNK